MRVAVPDTLTLVRALVSSKDGSGLHVVMALCPRRVDRVWLLSRIAAPHSTVTLEVLHLVADRLIRSILGMERWTAEELWRATMANWSVLDGDMLLDGVDVIELPPARATSVVLALWRRRFRHDSDGWRQFQRAIEKEPRREVRRQAEERAGAISPEQAAQFQQLAARAKGRPAAVDSVVTMPPPDTLSSR